MTKNPGAGCVFTNGQMILAGLQSKQNQLVISGIGGKSNEGETPHETAMRETIEELFGVTDVSTELILKLIELLPINKTCGTDIYSIYVYTFDDLIKLLQLASTYLISNLYEEFPSTLTDLIFKRKIDSNTEIRSLCLVPICFNLSFDPYFVEDINRLIMLPNENTL